MCVCVCDSDIYLNDDDDDNMIQQKMCIRERNVYKLVWKEDFVLILKFKILINTDDDDDDGFMCEGDT